MKQGKSILLLGAGNDNRGFLYVLKQNYKVFVIATDYNSNAEGKDLADLFINHSYLDIQDIIEKLNNISVNHVLLGTTAHHAYLPKLFLEKYCNLPIEVPIENARACIDKIQLDELLGQFKLPSLNTRLVSRRQFVNTQEESVILKSASGKNRNVFILKSGERMEVVEPLDMLCQNYVRGNEYRVDIFPGQTPFLMEKAGDNIYRNIPVSSRETGLVETVLKFNRAMGFENAITKYDVIYNDFTYIIDVGFDYPIRFCGLLKNLGVDYIDVLVGFYIEGINRFAEYIKEVNRSSKCVKGLTVL